MSKLPADDDTGIVTITPSKRLVLEDDEDEPLAMFDCLAIDNSFEDFASESPSLRAPLHLNLSTLDYLSHDSILYLAALIRWRVLRRQKTLISLPKNDECVDYLRSWRFPELIQEVTGIAFEDSLTADSREIYKSQIRELPTRVEVIETPSGGLEELLPKKHFAATPVALRGSPFQAASLEMNRWLESHLTAVLDRYLKNEGKRIATHVVLEAVLNAASHPKAHIAFTSSQFIRENYVLKYLDKEPYLEISIWDDGDPIAYTLQRAINDGSDVKSAAFGHIVERFTVRLVRTRGEPEVRVLDTEDPGIGMNFPWLTVSAFLAGITSRPRAQGTSDRTQAFVGLADELPVEYFDRGGLGLYLIRRNVIDLFKGRIRYMCQNYRMSMEGGGSRGVYEVLIQHRPETSWPLQGNLMVLEIPLNSPNSGR